MRIDFEGDVNACVGASGGVSIWVIHMFQVFCLVHITC